MIAVIVIATVVVLAVVATAIDTAHDGYRRIPAH